MELTPVSREDRETDQALVRKRMLVMLAAVAAIFVVIVAYRGITEFFRGEALTRLANVAQIVSTTMVTEQSWAPQIHPVGTLRAVNGTDLSFEIPGIVDEIDFESGEDIEAGRTLLRLRDDDAVAKLHSTEAMAQLAELTHRRGLELSKTQSVRPIHN